MDYRHAHILKGLVEEYIATGRPVGSSRLLEVLDVSVSSATIRNMLHALEEEGYLTSPHTSAGRIPTDKGYRYYVDQLSFRDPSERQVKTLQHTYGEYQETYTSPARAAAKMLSDMARVMAFSGWLDRKDVYGVGLSQVLEDRQRETQEAAREIATLFDNIERYVDDFAGDETRTAQVYIGNENPAFSSEHTSMIVRTMRLPTGERALLIIAGPKRMKYRKNVTLVNAMASILEQP